jgi:hypothetical protein
VQNTWGNGGGKVSEVSLDIVIKRNLNSSVAVGVLRERSCFSRITGYHESPLHH